MSKTNTQNVKEAVLVAEPDVATDQDIVVATEADGRSKASSTSGGTCLSQTCAWLIIIIVITSVGVGIGIGSRGSSGGLTREPTTPFPTTPYPTTHHTSLRPTPAPTLNYSRLDGIWNGTPITTDGTGSIFLNMSSFGRPNAHGYFISEFTISVTFPDDATLTGAIDTNYDTISWSDNTTWERAGT